MGHLRLFPGEGLDLLAELLILSGRRSELMLHFPEPSVELALFMLDSGSFFDLAVLIVVQRLQVLLQRSQLHKFSLVLSHQLLTLQQLILFERQLLAENLLLIRENIVVLFEADHVAVALIVLLLRIEAHLSLLRELVLHLRPLLHQKLYIVLLAIEGGQEPLLGRGLLALVALILHGGHLVLLKTLLEDGDLLVQSVGFVPRIVALLSHLLVVGLELLDAFGCDFVLLIYVLLGA